MPTRPGSPTFPLATGKKNSIAITSNDLRRIFDPVVECVYAYDVIEVARANKLFTGKDEEFSFSDTYNPLTFSGARFCEIRVWSFFRAVNDEMDQYLKYVSGHDLSKRMPLWIKPNRKISNYDMMNFMRDHLEGTEFDMRKDIGAGPFGSHIAGVLLHGKYQVIRMLLNIVMKGQQQHSRQVLCLLQKAATGFLILIGGIFWFGVDDAATTVFNPMYCGITEVPECFKVGNGDMLTYSPTSAFWLFNQVANLCYSRYDVMSAMH